ncbi:MAG: FoF1 ATP synthase subunit A, partial [Candidatus Binatia bacterium]
MAEGHSPLEQFKIVRLVDLCVGGTSSVDADGKYHCGGLDLSFTNSALFMVVAIALITLFLTASMRSRALVPGRWQSMAELAYEFIANMIRENVGNEGKKYFPFIISLFMFVLFANVLGMIPIPGKFTVTSHI